MMRKVVLVVAGLFLIAGFALHAANQPYGIVKGINGQWPIIQCGSGSTALSCTEHWVIGTGSEDPPVSYASDGDLFWRTDTQAFRVKSAGVWTSVSFSTSFPLRAPDGAVNAPSYSWTNETTSGWYRASNDVLNFSQNSSAVFGVNGTGGLQVYGGGTTAGAQVGGTASGSFSSIGNVGTGEDNLINVNYAPTNWSVTGEAMSFYHVGSFAATANNKRVRAYIGGSPASNLVFDTGVLATTSATGWQLTCDATRTSSSTTLRVACNWRSNDATLISDFESTSVGSLSFGLGLDWRVTGEATANNDIVNEIYRATYIAAN